MGGGGGGGGAFVSISRLPCDADGGEGGGTQRTKRTVVL